MFKKLWKFLTTPRYIEFGTLEDETDENINLDTISKSVEIAMDSKYMLISLYKRKAEIQHENLHATLDILKDWERKRALKFEGLLITDAQAKNEAEYTFKKFKDAGFVDELNNIKPAIKEVIQDLSFSN